MECWRLDGCVTRPKRQSVPFIILFLLIVLCQSCIVHATRFPDDDDSSELTSCEVDEIQLASDGTLLAHSVELGERIAPNTSMNGTVAQEDYHFYHVCIVRHQHEHQINIHLVSLEGDANLFLSSEEKYPMRGQATWISQNPGHDFVKLYTYLDGFPRKYETSVRSIPLHIGVFGATQATYNLSVAVLDLEDTQDIRSREAFYTERHEQDRRHAPYPAPMTLKLRRG